MRSYSNHSLNPLSTYNQMIHQHQLIWLRKKRNTRLKPSLTVTKKDNILSIWSNGKVTLMRKTPGNHVEMYDMPKKKWKTSTKNIQPNRNPLLQIEESLSLPIAQSLTPLNQCLNSRCHHGDHDLKEGGNVTISSFSTQTSAYPFQYHPIAPTLPNNHPIFPIFSFHSCITLMLHFIPDLSASDNLSRGTLYR